MEIRLSRLKREMRELRSSKQDFLTKIEKVAGKLQECLVEVEEPIKPKRPKGKKQKRKIVRTF